MVYCTHVCSVCSPGLALLTAVQALFRHITMTPAPFFTTNLLPRQLRKCVKDLMSLPNVGLHTDTNRFEWNNMQKGKQLPIACHYGHSLILWDQGSVLLIPNSHRICGMLPEKGIGKCLWSPFKQPHFYHILIGIRLLYHNFLLPLTGHHSSYRKVMNPAYL